MLFVASVLDKCTALSARGCSDGLCEVVVWCGQSNQQRLSPPSLRVVVNRRAVDESCYGKIDGDREIQRIVAANHCVFSVVVTLLPL